MNRKVESLLVPRIERRALKERAKAKGRQTKKRVESPRKSQRTKESPRAELVEDEQSNR